MSRQLDKRGIQVVRNLPETCPLIQASPENIKQLLLNLILNSCDAMPEGGELAVDMSCEDGSVVMSISDTGPGIEAELIPRVFEPFFTTKEPGKGTGLGLSVCYGITKRHGGSIEYKTGRPGACFEIHLPVGVPETDHD